MAWTLEDIRNRLRTTLGLPSSSGISDSLLNDYINNTMRFVLPLTLFPTEIRRTFYMNTSSGTRQYGLDPDMLTVVGQPYLEGERIQLTYEYEYFFDRVTDDDGEPNLALIHQGQLFLEPTPDDTYKVEIVALARPEKLEDDSDTIHKDSWALPIIYGTAQEFARDHGDLETASSVQEMFKYATDLARREELLEYTHRRAVPRL